MGGEAVPVSPFPGAVLPTGHLDPGAEPKLPLADLDAGLLAHGVRAAGAALLGDLCVTKLAQLRFMG